LVEDSALRSETGRTFSREDRRTFGEQGYILIPGVVPSSLVQDALRSIDGLLRRQPVPVEHRGHWSYWLQGEEHHTFLPLIADSPAFALAGSLVSPEALETPDFTQIALCVPPWKHHPGGPHIDGLGTAVTDGRPGTFTLLVGVFLTDQPAEDMGNLWVWPGSHLQYGAYLRRHGPGSLVHSEPAPPIELPEPRQVLERAGDVLLTHYLLGHNIGGNISDTVRRVAYFRLEAKGHRERWRECVQDPFREFELVRAAQV
jgi:ectoine hydroxylase-related dioxygenase (phytanoyl-CoA dioxygenase family)